MRNPTIPGPFTSKVWWKRLIILAAGSFMNFLTGLVVLAILYSCVVGLLDGEDLRLL